MIQLHSNSVWILISIACFIAGSGWGIALVYIRQRFFSEQAAAHALCGGEFELHLEEPVPSDLGRAGSSPSTASIEVVA